MPSPANWKIPLFGTPCRSKYASTALFHQQFKHNQSAASANTSQFTKYRNAYNSHEEWGYFFGWPVAGFLWPLWLPFCLEISEIPSFSEVRWHQLPLRHECDDNHHYSQKNHCNDNCNDFSDYNDIIAPLDKLIMLHYFRYCHQNHHQCPGRA